ncbi:unnamed protein product [Ambrosiozyma monospora]|uniref:Unnamed protein product n=1 Tax=Ambrosiozyma monospora TaxID=43982 RepID=A0ACB5TGM7_AMBMO|nr:unnamed protein product [Ambrosiozyma monospora]
MNYNVVTKIIQNKFEDAIKESLVLPFMDDFVLYPTDGEIFRGGIWDKNVRLNANASYGKRTETASSSGVRSRSDSRNSSVVSTNADNSLNSTLVPESHRRSSNASSSHSLSRSSSNSKSNYRVSPTLPPRPNSTVIVETPDSDDADSSNAGTLTKLKSKTKAKAKSKSRPGSVAMATTISANAKNSDLVAPLMTQAMNSFGGKNSKSTKPNLGVNTNTNTNANVSATSTSRDINALSSETSSINSVNSMTSSTSKVSKIKGKTLELGKLAGGLIEKKFSKNNDDEGIDSALDDDTDVNTDDLNANRINTTGAAKTKPKPISTKTATAKKPSSTDDADETLTRELTFPPTPTNNQFQLHPSQTTTSNAATLTKTMGNKLKKWYTKSISDFDAVLSNANSGSDSGASSGPSSGSISLKHVSSSTATTGSSTLIINECCLSISVSNTTSNSSANSIPVTLVTSVSIQRIT